MTDNDDLQLLTVEDIVSLAKIHENTVRRWINDGDLPVVEIGEREYRIRRSAFLKFIDEREKRRGKKNAPPL